MQPVTPGPPFPLVCLANSSSSLFAIKLQKLRVCLLSVWRLSWVLGTKGDPSRALRLEGQTGLIKRSLQSGTEGDRSEGTTGVALTRRSDLGKASLGRCCLSWAGWAMPEVSRAENCRRHVQDDDTEKSPDRQDSGVMRGGEQAGAGFTCRSCVPWARQAVGDGARPCLPQDIDLYFSGSGRKPPRALHVGRTVTFKS